MKSKRRQLVTAPAIEPVTIEEARRQCKIDGTDEDADLQEYITAARVYLETVAHRPLITQTWDVWFDWFADRLELPLPPLVSVTSVKYQDGNNVQQTLATSIYEVGNEYGVSFVRLAYDQQWPSTLGHADDVVVRIACGYGTTEASVPATARQAIKLMVTHMRENRSPIVTGTIVAELPFSLEALIESLKP